jgi:spore germination protein GerM
LPDLLLIAKKEICMKHLSKMLLIAVTLTVPSVGICAENGAKSEIATGKTYRVSDLYKDKDSLDRQQVTVKGKVVKVSSGIMGKNWIHLQDGSGKASAKNNDLTVTTAQTVPSVGKKVTVKGILYKGKDFGSGYYYDVIVEQATFK